MYVTYYVLYAMAVQKQGRKRWLFSLNAAASGRPRGGTHAAILLPTGPFKYYVSMFLTFLDPPTLSADVSISSYPP